MKVSIVTGVGGQDGSYLSELLLKKGYKVIGIKRRSATSSLSNLDNVIGHENFELVSGDITDAPFIFSCIQKYKPDEVYNLAAQSFVHSSFDQPIHTFHVDTEGVVNILEAVRHLLPTCKVYQASTSEMFGSSYSEKMVPNPECPQNNMTRMQYEEASKFGGIHCDCIAILTKRFQDESTTFTPQSPYAIAKLASHHMCRLYRESYGLKVSCGILFNHESPRRGKEFVTRKVTEYVAKLHIKSRILHTGFGVQSAYQDGFVEHGVHNGYSYIPKELADFPKLQLGNLSAYRDWGHAEDYVMAMWMMLQSENSGDYVVSTGETNSIEKLCEVAFNQVGLNWKDYVITNDKFKRPAEVNYLLGSSKKIQDELGWKPSINFNGLIEDMVKEDIRRNS